MGTGTFCSQAASRKVHPEDRASLGSGSKSPRGNATPGRESQRPGFTRRQHLIWEAGTPAPDQSTTKNSLLFNSRCWHTCLEREWAVNSSGFADKAVPVTVTQLCFKHKSGWRQIPGNEPSTPVSQNTWPTKSACRLDVACRLTFAAPALEPASLLGTCS